MKIVRIIAGELQTNSYIIYDKSQSKGFIIDPEANAEMFLNKISDLSLKIEGIILTHHHYDHRGAAAGIREKIKCPLYIHHFDSEWIPLSADVLLNDGDVIEMGDTHLKVINTPGHTKGSICLISEEERIVFTGDTIFNVDLGRTDLKDGSEKEMEKSIKDIISKWKDDWMLYPGHGDPCTMTYVRANNWEYQEVIKD